MNPPTEPPVPPHDVSTRAPLPFAARFWLAWVCWWTVLIDGVFAARVRELRALAPPLALASSGGEPAPRRELPSEPAPQLDTELREGAPNAVDAATGRNDSPAARVDAALQLLGLLQREGRFVDFLQQDIAPFSDTQIGQVARVVHDGCRKAIAAHADIQPVLAERESTRVELPQGFDPTAVKLTGNVTGHAPFHGVVRHRGWRAVRLALPSALTGHDPQILAPAEVEL